MEGQQRLTRRRKSVRIAARNASETLSWLFTASLLSMIRSADALLLRHHHSRSRVRKYKIKRGRIHYGNKWISIEKFQLVQVFSSSGLSIFTASCARFCDFLSVLYYLALILIGCHTRNSGPAFQS